MWIFFIVSCLAVFTESRHVIQCGNKVGDMCCTCPWGLSVKADRCIWDSEHMWCRLPFDCDLSTGRCKRKYDYSGACGFNNEPCCDGHCSSELACAKGVCVDTNKIGTCGYEKSSCCGEYEECDSELICEGKICKKIMMQ